MTKIKMPVDIDSVVQEYSSLREQAKILKNRMDFLATTIKDYASVEGVKDSKGSFFCENGAFVFGKQSKTSIQFTEEAPNWLLEQGHEDAVDTVLKVNSSVVETLIAQDKIKYADLEKITSSKTSYSVSVVEKEVIQMAQKTVVSLPVAASIKPKVIKRK